MNTVLVIDDHPIVLQGCARILEAQGPVNVLAAVCMADGFRLYRQKNPNLIIVDLTMNTGLLSGLSFIRRMRVINRSIPILVLSMHRDPVVVRRALQAGASGYVLKDSAAEDLLKAIQRVGAGRTFISDELTAEIVMMETRGQKHRLQSMTLRELELLSLLAEGKPYTSIAEELNVSYKTVANSVALIKNKLDVHTLPELMRIAIDQLPFTDSKVTPKRSM
ncbi:MAG TPA: response regulator transcription factor [Ancylobacter sp.]